MKLRLKGDDSEEEEVDDEGHYREEGREEEHAEYVMRAKEKNRK